MAIAILVMLIIAAIFWQLERKKQHGKEQNANSEYDSARELPIAPPATKFQAEGLQPSEATQAAPRFKPGVPQPIPSPLSTSTIVNNASPPQKDYEEVAFIDFETTGLDPEHDRIIEVGIFILKLGYSGQVEGRSSLVNPGCDVPKRITEITGITNAMISTAKSSKEIIAELLDEIGSRPVAAYNAKFDIAFLRAEASRIGRTFNNEWLCIMEYVKGKHPNLPRYRLTDVCEAFGINADAAEENGVSAHRALYDTELVLRLYLAISNGRQPNIAKDSTQFQTPISDNLSKYHGIRSAAKALAVKAKSDEHEHIEQAIFGYKSAIHLLKEASELNLYKRESQGSTEFVRDKKGDIDCLNRLTLCLCKLGLGTEASNATQDYFAAFPGDASLKAADQILRRINKATKK